MRYIPVLSCAVALATAAPALAAWTPMQPGWSVHEVPVGIAQVLSFPGQASLAIDPLSGDVFLAGSVSSGATSLSLLRISQAGQVQDLGLLSLPSTRPLFDPVHRVVVIQQGSQLARFTEAGAPLPPIPAPAAGPIAAGPDGELYAVSPGGQSASGLRIVRYDSGLDAWAPVRDVPPASGGGPGFGAGNLPDQFVLDDAGRAFVTTSSAALFRIDDAATVFLGSTLLAGQLAVGSGMALLGEGFFDPGAGSGGPAQGFAVRPDGSGLHGVAAAPPGTVVFLASTRNPDFSESFSLQVFTLGVTPTVHSSWGALKAAVH